HQADEFLDFSAMPLYCGRTDGSAEWIGGRFGIEVNQCRFLAWVRLDGRSKPERVLHQLRRIEMVKVVRAASKQIADRLVAAHAITPYRPPIRFREMCDGLRPERLVPFRFDTDHRGRGLNQHVEAGVTSPIPRKT